MGEQNSDTYQYRFYLQVFSPKYPFLKGYVVVFATFVVVLVVAVDDIVLPWLE
jgi:hypothetical protein